MVSQRRSELGQAVVQSALSDGEVGYVCNSEVSREQTFSAITALIKTLRDDKYLVRSADSKFQQSFRKFRANFNFGDFRPFATLIYS